MGIAKFDIQAEGFQNIYDGVNNLKGYGYFAPGAPNALIVWSYFKAAWVETEDEENRYYLQMNKFIDTLDEARIKHKGYGETIWQYFEVLEGADEDEIEEFEELLSAGKFFTPLNFEEKI